MHRCYYTQTLSLALALALFSRSLFSLSLSLSLSLSSLSLALSLSLITHARAHMYIGHTFMYKCIYLCDIHLYPQGKHQYCIMCVWVCLFMCVRSLSFSPLLSLSVSYICKVREQKCIEFSSNCLYHDKSVPMRSLKKGIYIYSLDYSETNALFLVCLNPECDAFEVV